MCCWGFRAGASPPPSGRRVVGRVPPAPPTLGPHDRSNQSAPSPQSVAPSLLIHDTHSASAGGSTYSCCRPPSPPRSAPRGSRPSTSPGPPLRSSGAYTHAKHDAARCPTPSSIPSIHPSANSYPFYLVSDFSSSSAGPPRWLIWLRYSAFIPLYPWGIASEARGKLFCPADDCVSSTRAGARIARQKTPRTRLKKPNPYQTNPTDRAPLHLPPRGEGRRQRHPQVLRPAAERPAAQPRQLPLLCAWCGP